MKWYWWITQNIPSPEGRGQHRNTLVLYLLAQSTSIRDGLNRLPRQLISYSWLRLLWPRQCPCRPTALRCFEVSIQCLQLAVFIVLSIFLNFIVSTDKLYFSPGNPPANRSGLEYTCFVDSSLVYTAFFADFGPLDLGLTYKFCKGLQDHIQAHSDRPACFFYGETEHSRSNGAVLILAYLVSNSTLSSRSLVILIGCNRFLS